VNQSEFTDRYLGPVSWEGLYGSAAHT